MLGNGQLPTPLSSAPAGPACSFLFSSAPSSRDRRSSRSWGSRCRAGSRADRATLGRLVDQMEDEGVAVPRHTVVSCSKAEWGAEGVGLWRAGAPSCGHRHGLIVHHTAVLTALSEESWHSERLRFGWVLRHSPGGSFSTGTSQASSSLQRDQGAGEVLPQVYAAV